MKKTLIALSCAAAIALPTIAVAQTGQGTNQSKGMNDDKGNMSNDNMSKGGMSKEGMSKEGMSKDGMSKDGMKDGMKKDNMSK